MIVWDCVWSCQAVSQKNGESLLESSISIAARQLKANGAGDGDENEGTFLGRLPSFSSPSSECTRIAKSGAHYSLLEIDEDAATQSQLR